MSVLWVHRWRSWSHGAREAEECCAKISLVAAARILFGAAPRMQLSDYLSGTHSGVGMGQLQASFAQGSVHPAALCCATMAATLHTLPSFQWSVTPSGGGSQEILHSGRNQNCYV